MKRAWLTDIDIRAGVAPPTTTVPWTPEATVGGGLETGGAETGGLESGPALDAGLDAGGAEPGLEAGRLNCWGLLTPPGIALDSVGD
ncbi:MAG TPA: hypothetical protein VIJ96_08070 [Acidothermaceae bacterium]